MCAPRGRGAFSWPLLITEVVFKKKKKKQQLWGHQTREQEDTSILIPAESLALVFSFFIFKISIGCQVQHPCSSEPSVMTTLCHKMTSRAQRSETSSFLGPGHSL